MLTGCVDEFKEYGLYHTSRFGLFLFSAVIMPRIHGIANKPLASHSSSFNVHLLFPVDSCLALLDIIDVRKIYLYLRPL